MNVDVLFTCWNRREFAQFSLGMLIRNTDWSLVRRLVIIDDGSTDGTREWLRDITAGQLVPCATRYIETDRLGGAPAIMNLYVFDHSAGAHAFAKVDSDIVMPEGWLNRAVNVLEQHAELDLLGLAGGWLGVDDGPAGYVRASHIGGVGLMRVQPFRDYGRMATSGVYGFTAFQDRSGAVPGWITPDVSATQLDLVPIEPWADLTAEYVAKGWARSWPPYSPASSRLWDSWPAPEEIVPT